MQTVVPFNEMDLPRAQQGVGPERSERQRRLFVALDTVKHKYNRSRVSNIRIVKNIKEREDNINRKTTTGHQQYVLE